MDLRRGRQFKMTATEEGPQDARLHRRAEDRPARNPADQRLLSGLMGKSFH